MSVLHVMIKKELLEIYRSKKFLILIILFAFVAISSPIIAKILPSILKSMPATPGLTINLPDPTWRDAMDQFIKNIGQIGSIVLFILFAGSISEEKNKKTLELVLTKPVSRTNFILAKFMANIGATKVVFILAAIVFYIYTTSLLGAFSLLNFVWLAIFLLIFIVFVISLSLFYSAIMNSSSTAIVMAFLTDVVISIIFGYVKALRDYTPRYVLNNYQDLMANGQLSHFWPSIITNLVLIIVLVGASVYFFRRQEVER